VVFAGYAAFLAAGFNYYVCSRSAEIDCLNGYQLKNKNLLEITNSQAVYNTDSAFNICSNFLF